MLKTSFEASEFAIPFSKLKNLVLGRNFELSLAFIDSRQSRKINRIYRNQDKPADVLSFPLSPKSGEILIDLITAKKEMKDFGLSFQKFVALLFIHGLLHLKGMRHGATMEKKERELLNDASNYNRH